MTRTKLFGCALVLSVLAHEGNAADHVVAFYAPPNPSADNRPCAFYRTESSGAGWYEIPQSSPNYDAQVAAVLGAFLNGTPVSSWGTTNNGSTCGFPLNMLFLDNTAQ